MDWKNEMTVLFAPDLGFSIVQPVAGWLANVCIGIFQLTGLITSPEVILVVMIATAGTVPSVLATLGVRRALRWFGQRKVV